MGDNFPHQFVTGTTLAGDKTSIEISIKRVVIITSTAPIIAVYVKGMLAGSIKGWGDRINQAVRSTSRLAGSGCHGNGVAA